MKALSLLAALFLGSAAFAQQNFQQSIGGQYDDAILSVDTASDGDLLLAGYYMVDGTDKDAFMAKLSPDGAIVRYAHSLGGINDDEFRHVIHTKDGNILLAGSTYSYGFGSQDIFVSKMTNNGAILWSRVFGGTGVEVAWAVLETDTYYYITGRTMSFGTSDIILICLYKNGVVRWVKTYNSGIEEGCNAILQGNDGSLMLTGGTYPMGSPHDNMMAKLDTAGNVLWAKKYHKEDEGAFAICKAYNGGYLIGGIMMEANDLGIEDYLLMRINEAGTLLWIRQYGGSQYQNIAHVIQSYDGNYYLYGHTDSYGFGGEDLNLTKVDTSGNVIWSRNYGSNQDDAGVTVHVPGTSIIELADHGLLMGSSITGPGSNDLNGYLIKTNSDGFSACNDSVITIGSMNSTMSTTAFAITGTLRNISDTLSINSLSRDYIRNLLCMYMGTDEPAVDQEFSVFPNPCNDKLYLTLPYHETDAIAFIYDACGRLVSTQVAPANSDKSVLSVSQLQTGIYFLILTDNNHQYKTKFVKE